MRLNGGAHTQLELSFRANSARHSRATYEERTYRCYREWRKIKRRKKNKQKKKEEQREEERRRRTRDRR
jgi:hypothetical protein